MVRGQQERLDESRPALIGIAFGTVLAWAWLVARTWLQRSRQREALADLNDRLLRDIGVGRADAEREINKPFWQP